jgi:hypothetical protein
MSLALVSLLPLYVERTMMHVMYAHGGGGTIEWGWKRCTLREYWETRHYMQPEQEPAKWLGVNIALALAYATIVAVPMNRAMRRL